MYLQPGNDLESCCPVTTLQAASIVGLVLLHVLRETARKRGNERSRFLSLGLQKARVEPVACFTSSILRECGTGIGGLCGDMQHGAGSCSLKYLLDRFAT